jgi:hypothetical protein
MTRPHTPILDAWISTPPRLDRDELIQRMELIQQCENPKLAVLAEAIFEEVVKGAAARLVR